MRQRQKFINPPYKSLFAFASMNNFTFYSSKLFIDSIMKQSMGKFINKIFSISIFPCTRRYGERGSRLIGPFAPVRVAKMIQHFDSLVHYRTRISKE